MLSHNKLCHLSDFSELAPVIRRVVPHEVGRFGPNFPVGFEHRKYWEIAMAVRALEDGGAVRPDAEILGVGAGVEPTGFHLTNHVKRVFATDLFAPDPPVYFGRLSATMDAIRGRKPSSGWSEASAESMRNPGSFWPSPWKPRRLVIQHMNALDLWYDDNTFDGIYSSSSLEHFGGFCEAERAIQEMHRVLKPGGILTISTDFE
jgi:SAM-dependent methyltransferase